MNNKNDAKMQLAIELGRNVAKTEYNEWKDSNMQIDKVIKMQTKVQCLLYKIKEYTDIAVQAAMDEYEKIKNETNS